jgi:hypothetical protein
MLFVLLLGQTGLSVWQKGGGQRKAAGENAKGCPNRGRKVGIFWLNQQPRRPQESIKREMKRLKPFTVGRQ